MRTVPPFGASRPWRARGRREPRGDEQRHPGGEHRERRSRACGVIGFLQSGREVEGRRPGGRRSSRRFARRACGSGCAERCPGRVVAHQVDVEVGPGRRRASPVRRFAASIRALQARVVEVDARADAAPRPRSGTKNAASVDVVDAQPTSDEVEGLTARRRPSPPATSSEKYLTSRSMPICLRLNARIWATATRGGRC